MTQAILRARLTSGAEWKDPSEDLLFELLGDIAEGTEETLTLERLDEDARPAIRVGRVGRGGWFVDDLSNSGIDRKLWTDRREVHEWVTRWAFRIVGEAEAPALRAFGVGLVVYQGRAMRFVVEDLGTLQRLPIRPLPTGSAGIAIVFEVPARSFSGLRVRSFERKARTVGIDVGVPPDVAPDQSAAYIQSTLELALRKAEEYVARKKLPLSLDAARSAIQEAIAGLPAATLSAEARYRQIIRPKSQDMPVRTYLELDGAGRDLRRVDVYADGRMDYAVRTIETGTTRLSAQRLENRSAEDLGTVLPEGEFLAIWDRAIGQPAPRGPIRVIESF